MERLREATTGNDGTCFFCASFVNSGDSHNDGCILPEIIAVLDAQPVGHVHRWVDARNQAVISGSMCFGCGAIRAEDAALASEPQPK